ncbi:MAG TPA: tRNA pseudouridine(55) synthase TruB [Candidatus Polarisedimenticolia bacterium]
MTPFEGVLVVDKPAGPTSHDVVEEVRQFTGRLRVGHTGTLDPFATGVLPLCVGRATRLSRFLTAARKLYAGAIRLGVTTDTYDSGGRVMATRGVEGLSATQVREAAARFAGAQMQAPPPFSARKINGQPMHRLARRGIEVPLTPVPVTIFRLDILECAGGVVRFEVETSPGTYVRSLAHDLGEVLGCGAHLEQLRRLASGSFTAEVAHPLSEVRASGSRGALDEIGIGLNDLDLGLPAVTTTPDGAAAMRHGRTLTVLDIVPGQAAAADAGPFPGAVRVEDERGNLLGVAIRTTTPEGELTFRPAVVLAS